MLGWVVALVILVCFIAYVGMDYRIIAHYKRTIQELEGKNYGLLRGAKSYIKKKKQETAFVATFEKVGMDSIENSLHQMISRAQSEILIVSPWIKEVAWQRIYKRVTKFVNNGGAFTLIIKGAQEDFEKGTSDFSVVEAVRRLGCTVRFVPDLHAKLYVIDRCEVLIASANFTRRGLDFGYEAGVWTCNPVVVQDALAFIEELPA